MKVRREQTIRRAEAPQGKRGTPVKAEPKPNLSLDMVPKERYTDPEFLKKEYESVFKKVWLLGCREDDIPDLGDHIVTEIGSDSILIVRQKDGTIKAFYNVCLHRGNQLVHSCDNPVKGAETFRCGYHDWQYRLDGRFFDIPDAETFQQGVPPCGGLAPVQCDTWGSFVWYSLDPDAEPLLDYLGVIPKHLDPYHFERMVLMDCKTVEWDCNWKCSVDAFNESYHVQGTHPQLLYYLDDLDIQIDCYEKHTRYLIAFGVVSPRVFSPAEIPPPLKVVLRSAGIDPASYEGSVYDIRDAVQKQKRTFGEEQGQDFSDLNDDQLTDDYNYTIFPNVTMNVHADDLMMFRQRPHPTDPNKMYFDYYMFELPNKDFDWDNYKRPEHRFYKYGETSLGLVINQDAYNLPFVQKGMQSEGYPGLWLGDQELRIRHFHSTLEKYVTGFYANPTKKAKR